MPRSLGEMGLPRDNINVLDVGASGNVGDDDGGRGPRSDGAANKKSAE